MARAALNAQPGLFFWRDTSRQNALAFADNKKHPGETQ
jgi:hypothetical protein